MTPEEMDKATQEAQKIQETANVVAWWLKTLEYALTEREHRRNQPPSAVQEAATDFHQTISDIQKIIDTISDMQKIIDQLRAENVKLKDENKHLRAFVQQIAESQAIEMTPDMNVSAMGDEAKNLLKSIAPSAE